MSSQNKGNPLDSYLDSLTAHYMDQSMASTATLADMVAVFYTRLRADAVPPAATLDLTRYFLGSLMISSKESK